MDTDDIDEVGYSILKLIQDEGNPMWKKKIHQHLLDNLDALPELEAVSVQTVGRRVDDMHKKNFLESVIISSGEIKRDLIIAYALTEPGEEILEAKRSELLRHLVRDTIFTKETETPPKPYLQDLLVHELELSDTLDRFSAEELLLLAAMYVTSDIFEDFDESKIADLETSEDNLRDILDTYRLGKSIQQDINKAGEA